jgi:hypothetical protein
MTRAQRFGTLAGSLSIFYALAFFSVVPIPLVSADVASQLLPVVRTKPFLQKYICGLLAIASFLDIGYFRVLCPVESRLGTFHLQRLSRGIHGVNEGQHLYTLHFELAKTQFRRLIKPKMN